MVAEQYPRGYLDGYAKLSTGTEKCAGFRSRKVHHRAVENEAT